MNHIPRHVLRVIALALLALLVIPFSSSSASDNNINWNELGHDSRDALYRSPSGAVPIGTPVRLRFRALDGDLTGVDVRVYNRRTQSEAFYPMTRVAESVLLPDDPTLYEFWEVTLPPSPLPTIYWYRFIARDGTAVAYYEDNDFTGGWGQPYASSPDYSWQLTFYDPTFSTPDWVKDAVIYQIFPDRFRDGDPANNPEAGQFNYGDFNTIVRSNTTEWNTAVCDPRENFGGAMNCEMAWGHNFYGGDLQGIIDQMDYIQSLGVTAIYLNPIFFAPSNHKYDTIDFMTIDPAFGDLATFDAMIAAADARGIRIILDSVFNHSSSDSIYFDRYSRWDADGNATTIGDNDGSGACESTTSPYFSWYTFFPYVDGDPADAPCSDGRDYPKWFGIFDSLPVFNSANQEVRDFFFAQGVNSVGPYWIDRGAAGWRLDVAPEIDGGQIYDPNNDYWELFRDAIHAIDPEAYIVGEEWALATSWTVGGEWDATMNYQFASSVLSFWRDSVYVDNDFNASSSAGVLNPIGPSGYCSQVKDRKRLSTQPDQVIGWMVVFV